jgi:hypothetical protein
MLHVFLVTSYKNKTSAGVADLGDLITILAPLIHRHKLCGIQSRNKKFCTQLRTERKAVFLRKIICTRVSQMKTVKLR